MPSLWLTFRPALLAPRAGATCPIDQVLAEGLLRTRGQRFFQVLFERARYEALKVNLLRDGAELDRPPEPAREAK